MDKQYKLTYTTIRHYRSTNNVKTLKSEPEYYNHYEDAVKRRKQLQSYNASNRSKYDLYWADIKIEHPNWNKD